MKTMFIEESSRGKKTVVSANNTYQTDSGKWIAEVDSAEFNRACLALCHGIDACTCEGLHVQADLDDDGKEYRVELLNQ